MDNNLVGNLDMSGLGFQDNFVSDGHNCEAPHNTNQRQASGDVTQPSYTNIQNINSQDYNATFHPSGQESNLSFVNSRQSENISSEFTRQESDLEAGLRRYSVHTDVQNASAYYAKMHYSEERDETIKCVASSIFFVAIIAMVLVYMFVVNPQV